MNELSILTAVLCGAIWAKLYDPLTWVMMVAVVGFAAHNRHNWTVALWMAALFTLINIAMVYSWSGMSVVRAGRIFAALAAISLVTYALIQLVRRFDMWREKRLTAQRQRLIARPVQQP